MCKVKSKIHIEKITRRNEVESKSDYRDYREILVEDFRSQCGYCGKNQELLLDKYHIDHFAPKSKFEELECEYSNLVLACPNCNRLKSDKWFGDCASVPNNGYEGFVDPVNDEYNKHLGRDVYGNIVWLTPLGEYMYGVFKFDIRPTRLFWKLEILMKLKNLLAEDDSEESNRKFKEIQLYIDRLQKLLKYDKNE